MNTRLTRRTGRRGTPVTLALRDGATVHGHIDGWGPTMVRIYDTNGRWREFVASTVTVTRREVTP
jgi:hypothetical protein